MHINKIQMISQVRWDDNDLSVSKIEIIWKVTVRANAVVHIVLYPSVRRTFSFRVHLLKSNLNCLRRMVRFTFLLIGWSVWQSVICIELFILIKLLIQGVIIPKPFTRSSQSLIFEVLGGPKSRIFEATFIDIFLNFAPFVPQIGLNFVPFC